MSCSLYPNIALPHEKNKERSSADCLFHTRQVPFTNLHPSSSLYPELSNLLGPGEGLAFGSILQTHMPFLTHVVKCPVVPTVLLCAASVDTSADCSMLICDEWLQLSFEDAEEAMCLLEDTHCLRRAIQRALDHELLELFDAGCDDDVSESLVEPDTIALPASAPPRLFRYLARPPPSLSAKHLKDRVLELWKKRPRCRWQALTPNEYTAFKEAAQEKQAAQEKPVGEPSDGRPAFKKPGGTGSGSGSGAGAGAGADAGGAAGGGATLGWLRYGTVSEEGVNLGSSLVSDHLAVAWPCPRCKHTFRFTRRDIADHEAECVGDEAASRGELPKPSGVVAPTAAALAAAAPASGARPGQAPLQRSKGLSSTRPQAEPPQDDEGPPGWRCDQCGLVLPAEDAMGILQHRRSHGL